MNTDKALTVEEAAKIARDSLTNIGDFAIDHPYNEGYHTGYLDGAAWQKEQGWDWFPTATCKLVPSLGRKVLLLFEDGETVLCGKRLNSATGEIWIAYYSDGEGICPEGSVTHWCYIQLPK